MLRKEYKKQLSDLDLKIYSKIKTKISTLIDIVSQYKSDHQSSTKIFDTNESFQQTLSHLQSDISENKDKNTLNLT